MSRYIYRFPTYLVPFMVIGALIVQGLVWVGTIWFSLWVVVTILRSMGVV